MWLYVLFILGYIYMITMKFGMEEYTIGPHLHAKFGHNLGWWAGTRAPKVENFVKKNCCFGQFSGTSVLFPFPYPFLAFPLSLSFPSLSFLIFFSPSPFFPSHFPSLSSPFFPFLLAHFCYLTFPVLSIPLLPFPRGGSRNFHLGRPVKEPSKFWVGQQESCTFGRISFG